MSFKKNLPWYLLLAFLISFVVLVFNSEGTAGGADDYNHYRYCRYAYSNPGFFFDTKAKTLFTFLFAPVAQIGYNAVRVFNVIIGLAAAFITYLTVRRLNYGQPLLALFLLVFAPMYTLMMLSGMTEILFSFVLILGIYLFFRKEFVWAAITISMLPFARTEGVIVLPLFLLAFALIRQWKAIPFLLTGFLVVSFAGSFYHGDFFWVITRNPYNGAASDIYGSGPLLHYVNRFQAIFGLPFFILIVAGLLYIPYHFFRVGRADRTGFVNEVLVGFLPFLAYFSAHSYIYWKGIGNSVGLTRVMAAVFPSAVLLAISGWNGLMRIFKLPELIRNILAGALAVYLIFVPFRVHRIPVELSPPTKKLIKEAATWLEEMEYVDRKLYFWDPFWWFFLDINPTDQARIREGLYDRSNPGRGILPGEIVLWDAHFGPNEGKTPLERLKNNPDFAEIKVFRPEHPFTVLGGYDYTIHIFERLKNPDQAEKQALLEEIQQREDSFFNIRMLGFNDFEDIAGREDTTNFSSKYSKSGSYAYRLHKDRAFLQGIEIPFEELNPSAGAKIRVRLSYFFESLEGDDPLWLVLSLQDGENVTYCRTWAIQADTLGIWEDNEYELNIPDPGAASDVLKLYLWDMGGHRVYVDDFSIALKEPRL